MDFTKYNININIIESLKKVGIKEPTTVQDIAIPKILLNESLAIKSNTGTGKTLSFIIPILNIIIDDNKKKFLILAPTRELVIQISNEINKILLNLEYDILVSTIYGGKDIKTQKNKLSKLPNIIVATPGRLIDHINKDNIDLKDFNNIILDEADQMILMGFKNDLELILRKIPKVNLFLMFSATIDSKVKKVAYKFKDNITFIDSNSEESIPDLIQQEFIMTTDRNKYSDFKDKISKDRPFLSIVFCRTKQRVDSLELKLATDGINCQKIHSDISQNKRERILKDFRDLKIEFLISTDLASRGLDIEGLTHIYNYDFPETVEDYIHRIGRIGRLNKKGNACSFITEKNQSVYDDVKKKLEL